ncbi:MAG: glycosyltransferase [Rufibacter sp.]
MPLNINPHSSANPTEFEIAIICPCFNENVTVIKFLTELEQVLASSERKYSIVVVDDASIDNTLALLQQFQLRAENLRLHLVSLQYNLGHQGAIYQGLLYTKSLNFPYAIIMDADGEDDPNAILELEKFIDQPVDMVHVVRGKRKEKFSFRLFYLIYKILFRLVTNHAMNFGNYCLINRRIIDATVDTSFIHFAAYLGKQKARRASIICDRRKRLDGKSSMNLSSLVHHAFKSFVENAEDLLMVFLKLFIILALSIILLIGIIIYQKLFTNNAILGWASTLSASLFNTALLCLGFFVVGVLLLNIIARQESKQRQRIYQVIK